MITSTLMNIPAGALASGRPYVEREEREPGWHDAMATWLWHAVAVPLSAPFQGAHSPSVRAFVRNVDHAAFEFERCSDDELRAHGRGMRALLRKDGLVEASVARCFALVREAAGRVLDKRHFETQLVAGWWLLQGTLVEMATGEGKTFAATLPACTAALAGMPVHVVTVNDYLAQRDADAMGPLYAFFGLRCSAIVHDMSRGQRRDAYAGDITYASNKELAFDYLRDRASLGDRASPLHLATAGLRDGPASEERVVLRGLVYAIVDEADSVFIDEARTPLILSATRDAGGQQAVCEVALAAAAALVEGKDFEVDPGPRSVRLTDDGRAALDEMSSTLANTASMTAAFATTRERDEQVQRALSALALYHRDEHYVVMEGKVQIVDASTGRIMPDRAWERGLHQMIETKEGLALTGDRVTLARITYQRLFRRYLRLAGMTGTATEVAAEIGRTYGLRVKRVPLHRPSRRVMWPTRCLRTQEEKWRVVADAVVSLAEIARRPVLVGTRTVRASEAISQVLSARDVAHVVLNAKQDRYEAEIIATAGHAGRISVATNMAGRGTDILLGEDVANRGGLHVILTEFNETARIDRQLFGRSARQGDAGSAQCIVAFDDELFITETPRLAGWLSRLRLPEGLVLRMLVGALCALAQYRSDRRSRSAREDTLAQDRRLAKSLAFTGRGE